MSNKQKWWRADRRDPPGVPNDKCRFVSLLFFLSGGKSPGSDTQLSVCCFNPLRLTGRKISKKKSYLDTFDLIIKLFLYVT